MYNQAMLPELSRRWQAIQAEMKKAGADACLITGNVNLFYVANRVFSGYFYLPSEGEPTFFVKRPVGLNGNNVVYIRKPEQIAEILVAGGNPLPKTLLLETDELTYNDVMRLQSVFSPEKTLNATSVLRLVRTVKSDFEISLFRESAAIHSGCYKQIAGLYKPGMSDLDFSIEIEQLFRKNGSLGHFRIFGQSMEIFMGSVLAGDNAMAPSPYDFAMGGSGAHNSLPIGCNGSVMTPGMSVMVDMGGTFTGYITDMTRVYSVGKLSQQACDAHQVALEIQSDIEAMAKPGVAACELYNLAFAKAAKYNLSDYFMGYGQQAGFVGHGVGIEINESPVLAPRSREVLLQGHIFALEPKFVIPGTGAVGIENTFLVTESGIEKLTQFDENIQELGF